MLVKGRYALIESRFVIVLSNQKDAQHFHVGQETKWNLDAVGEDFSPVF